MKLPPVFIPYENFKRTQNLLIQTLEWVEHNDEYVNDYSGQLRYCMNYDGDCLKCEILKSLETEE